MSTRFRLGISVLALVLTVAPQACRTGAQFRCLAEGLAKACYDAAENARWWRPPTRSRSAIWRSIPSRLQTARPGGHPTPTAASFTCAKDDNAAGPGRDYETRPPDDARPSGDKGKPRRRPL